MKAQSNILGDIAKGSTNIEQTGKDAHLTIPPVIQPVITLSESFNRNGIFGVANGINNPHTYESSFGINIDIRLGGALLGPEVDTLAQVTAGAWRFSLRSCFQCSSAAGSEAKFCAITLQPPNVTLNLFRTFWHAATRLTEFVQWDLILKDAVLAGGGVGPAGIFVFSSSLAVAADIIDYHGILVGQRLF